MKEALEEYYQKKKSGPAMPDFFGMKFKRVVSSS